MMRLPVLLRPSGLVFRAAASGQAWPAICRALEDARDRCATDRTDWPGVVFALAADAFDGASLGHAFCGFAALLLCDPHEAPT